MVHLLLNLHMHMHQMSYVNLHVLSSHYRSTTNNTDKVFMAIKIHAEWLTQAGKRLSLKKPCSCVEAQEGQVFSLQSLSTKRINYLCQLSKFILNISKKGSPT